MLRPVQLRLAVAPWGSEHAVPFYDTTYLTGIFAGTYLTTKIALYRKVKALQTVKQIAINYLRFCDHVTHLEPSLRLLNDVPLSPAEIIITGHAKIDAIHEKMIEHDDWFWVLDGYCTAQWETDALTDLRALKQACDRVDIAKLSKQSAEQIGAIIQSLGDE